jgi:cellulose synthase/poly-beta-1,6-N-acetylglucosamine synthase-like glycosyltransferase
VVIRSGLFPNPFMPDTEVAPDISILIAARNEETTILICLRAISALDYPTDRIEVLIGNDQSTDATAALVTDYIADKPHFRLITTADSPVGLRGKANVLAQLAQQARGAYLFFTDADTQVSPDWLMAMRRQFTGRVGVVTGVTLPDGPRLFHKLQHIDWLYNLTLTHLMSSFGFAITAMGNNMAVSREAYKSVGGYEALPFSVVEDYTLFKAIVGHGFDFRNVLTEEVLARTKPVDTLRHFLDQRKRWMRGATDLPLWMVVSLYAQYLAGPLLLLLGWFLPVLAVGVYLLKLFVQTLVISFGLGRLRQTSLMPYALLFEIYQLIIGPVSVLYYLSPNPIEWKGRNYR